MPSAKGERVCVLCRQRPAVAPWRPFCSDRCKTRDLANWASQSYLIPATPVDDAWSEIDGDATDDAAR